MRVEHGEYFQLFVLKHAIQWNCSRAPATREKHVSCLEDKKAPWSGQVDLGWRDGPGDPKAHGNVLNSIYVMTPARHATSESHETSKIGRHFRPLYYFVLCHPSYCSQSRVLSHEIQLIFSIIL